MVLLWKLLMPSRKRRCGFASLLTSHTLLFPSTLKVLCLFSYTHEMESELQCVEGVESNSEFYSLFDKAWCEVRQRASWLWTCCVASSYRKPPHFFSFFQKAHMNMQKHTKGEKKTGQDLDDAVPQNIISSLQVLSVTWNRYVIEKNIYSHLVYLFVEAILEFIRTPVLCRLCSGVCKSFSLAQEALRCSLCTFGAHTTSE